MSLENVKDYTVMFGLLANENRLRMVCLMLERGGVSLGDFKKIMGQKSKDNMLSASINLLEKSKMVNRVVFYKKISNFYVNPSILDMLNLVLKDVKTLVQIQEDLAAFDKLKADGELMRQVFRKE